MSELERRARELYYLHSTVWRELRIRWEQRTDQARTFWIDWARKEQGHA